MQKSVHMTSYHRYCLEQNRLQVPPGLPKNMCFVTTPSFYFFILTDRVDRASATEIVDSRLIPGRFKPKAITFGIHSFPA